MLDYPVAQPQCDRHLAPPGCGLQNDLALHVVPAALDSDHSGGDVYVADTQRPQLPPAKARVHRGCPDRPVALRRRCDQCLGFGRVRKAITPAACCGQLQPVAGVDSKPAPADGPAEDRPQRENGAADGRRVQALCEQPINERLHVEAPHVRQPNRAQHRQHPHPHRLLIGAQGGRLVDVAGAVAGHPGLGALVPRLPRLPDRGRLRCQKRACSSMGTVVLIGVRTGTATAGASSASRKGKFRASAS